MILRYCLLSSALYLHKIAYVWGCLYGVWGCLVGVWMVCKGVWLGMYQYQIHWKNVISGH